jgi:hypothetical protein
LYSDIKFCYYKKEGLSKENKKFSFEILNINKFFPQSLIYFFELALNSNF